MRRRLRAYAGALVVASALVVPAPATGQPPAGVVRAAPVPRGRVIGHSVDGRPITAWHLGEPTNGSDGTTRTVVLIATMHGDEPAAQHILQALRDGPAVHGIDLWVVPVYNPDGLAAGSRRNAHGVDLNRNYPYHWAPLTGNYDAGPRPGSEPETRAMMGFLEQVRPDIVLSFHQPLHGVDTDVERPAFARRVARALHLPPTRLDCGGVCHGTMTGWFNHSFPGFALTVEYGAHPSAALMSDVAPRQVLSIFPAASRGPTTPVGRPMVGQP